MALDPKARLSRDLPSLHSVSQIIQTTANKQTMTTSNSTVVFFSLVSQMNKGLDQKQQSNSGIYQGKVWSFIYIFERDLHHWSLSN